MPSRALFVVSILFFFALVACLEQASRHGFQFFRPEHGGAVEHWRWKYDEPVRRTGDSRADTSAAASARACGHNLDRKAGKCGGIEAERAR